MKNQNVANRQLNVMKWKGRNENDTCGTDIWRNGSNSHTGNLHIISIKSN